MIFSAYAGSILPRHDPRPGNTLFLTAENADCVKQHGRSPTGFHPSKRQVLTVEFCSRRLLCSSVEINTGFEIYGKAENGPEGFETAKELRPDLILLDLALLGMSRRAVNCMTAEKIDYRLAPRNRRS
jgi:hypothetical protein